MRYFIGFVLVLALGVMGCSETSGTGGSAGDGGGGGGAAGVGGGVGGTGGDGGSGGMPECLGNADCDEGNECTRDICSAESRCENPPVEDGTECDWRNDCTVGVCTSGTCESTPIQDGATCGDGAGTCEAGSCVGTFACTEQGIRDAIDVGGGPHTFDCDGATEVKTLDEIVIDNDVILDGEGNLAVDGTRRVFSVPEFVTAELHGFTVTGGVATGSDDGGGIENLGTLTLTGTTVSGNFGSWGGGIANSGGTLTLTNCTVSGNDAVRHGGGISNVGGTATLTNSTVSGNTALSGSGIDNSGGTLALTNSTVSGNTSEGSCGRGICGGAIWNAGGTLAIVNSTVSENTRGGIWNIGLPNAMATVVSSTVSENTGDNIANLGGEAVLAFTNSVVAGGCTIVDAATTNGYNIESPGDTCDFDQPTDQVSVSADDLKLGPLQDNGGPTMTHALGDGSVAIDVIPAEECVDAGGAPLATDQRAVARPQGSACDAGAVEVTP